MKEIKCKNCGNNNLKLYAGKYTCEHCGSIFVAESNDTTVANRLGSFDIEDDVLIEYCGFDRVVEIPEGITCVAEGAFDHTSVRTIRCPPSVTKFEGTLKKCKNLQTFEAPGLKEIARDLFSDNKTIKKVVLESVREIPASAFVNCLALKEVILPKATIIREYAFYQSGLVSLNAPKVKAIENSGICCCNNLEEIKLPALEIVGESGFSCCDQLKHVVLPKAKIIEEEAFGNCINLEYIEAPKLEILGIRSFYACDSLERVFFPNVQSINEYAFADCVALTEVVCEKATLVANSQGNYNQFVGSAKIATINLKEMPNKKKILKEDTNNKKSGCYIATCVYGSYDCPQVWTLRRYRDNTLAATWYGRAFVRTYYTISPTLVKWFGNTEWFKKLWKGKLDKMIVELQADGFEATPYEDTNW